MEDGRKKMEEKRWKMEDGRWKMEDYLVVNILQELIQNQ